MAFFISLIINDFKNRNGLYTHTDFKIKLNICLALIYRNKAPRTFSHLLLLEMSPKQNA